MTAATLPVLDGDTGAILHIEVISGSFADHRTIEQIWAEQAQPKRSHVRRSDDLDQPNHTGAIAA